MPLTTLTEAVVVARARPVEEVLNMVTFGRVTHFITYDGLQEERGRLQDLDVFLEREVETSRLENPFCGRVLAVVGVRLLPTDRRTPVPRARRNHRPPQVQGAERGERGE